MTVSSYFVHTPYSPPISITLSYLKPLHIALGIVHFLQCRVEMLNKGRRETETFVEKNKLGQFQHQKCTQYSEMKRGIRIYIGIVISKKSVKTYLFQACLRFLALYCVKRSVTTGKENEKKNQFLYKTVQEMYLKYFNEYSAYHLAQPFIDLIWENLKEKCSRNTNQSEDFKKADYVSSTQTRSL